MKAPEKIHLYRESAKSPIYWGRGSGDTDKKEITYVRFDIVEKRERIAYLKGITKYTAWADSVPNGNEICDKYQEELKQLTNSE